MIRFKHKGDFKKTIYFFENILQRKYLQKLQQFGEEGVKALALATPKDSGETANSWSYEIIESQGRTAIIWKNSHIHDGVNIAIILQYGHGTRNGGYVQGRDYINPAIAPIFNRIAEQAWDEITKL